MTRDNDEELERLRAVIERQRSMLQDQDRQRAGMLAVLEELENNRRQIEQAKREWTAIFDSVDDPIFVHDADYQVVRANRAYAERAGMDFDSLLGRPYWELFPRGDGPLPGCVRVLEGGGSYGDEEITLPGGETFISRMFPILDEENNYQHSIHVLVDISERKEAQRQTETLRTVIEDLSTEPDLDTLGLKAVQAAVRLTGADMGTVPLLDEDGALLSHRWHVGLPVDAIKQVAHPYRRDQGLTSRVLESGHTEVIDDYPRFDNALPEYVKAGVQSIVIAPVQAGGRVLGVLAVSSLHRVLSFRPEQIRILEAIARQIGVAVQRDRLTREIAESEQRFRQVVENVPDVLFVLKVPELALGYVNSTVADMLGYEPEELLGDPQLWRQRIHPDDRERAIAEMSRAADAAEGIRLEMRLLHKHGHVVWVDGRAMVARDESGTPTEIFGVITDISQRKRSEESLQRANRALRTISAGNEVLVRAKEEDVLLRDICQVVVERGGYPMAWVGYPVDDGKRIVRPMAASGSEDSYLKETSITWDGPPSGLDPTGRAIRDRQPVIVADIRSAADYGPWRECALEHGFNSSIALPLCHNQRAIGALTIYAAEPRAFDTQEESLLRELAEDLAYGIRMLRVGVKERQAQQKLRESEQRFRSIDEAALDAVLMIDDQARVQGWNPAATRIFGYSATEAIGAPLHDLIAPTRLHESINRGFARFQQTGTGSVVGKTIEIEARRKDGTEFPVELSISALRLDDKWHAVGIVKDITDRRQSSERIKRALVQTIQAVSLTIEKRDPYTAGHQQRVARVAVALAAQMGLDEDRIEGVRMGGLIHDIGKVYIPSEILSRPGRLSPAEFELVKTHPEVGYEIIKDVEFDWPVADMVLQHHERMDGSGYPRGLKGDAICTEARILAVADVVEAMASHRPYRPGLGIDRALAEIGNNRGKYYDSDVVDACSRLFRETGFTLE